MKIDPLNITFTPLPGSTFTNLVRLLAQNRFKIDVVGIPRMLYSFLMSIVLSPLYVYEKFRFHRRIRETQFKTPPIFIIGHWRSGTTYLHNLITQDTNFAYPTTFQTVTPGLFLSFEKLIKPIVASSLPEKRPEDDVAIGVDYPQEEEYAMGNLSPYSFYNGWCFPRNMEFYYKFVAMNGIPERCIEEWKRMYLYYLKKVSLYFHGKQLVLKNPANTARIAYLLEMFPDAKFIHIYRNPYHVFLSMKRDIEAEMALYCIQKPKDDEIIERAMVALYITMFDKYLKEKSLIPPENLVEVKYENFIARPLDEMKRIYRILDLPGFQVGEEAFRSYVKSQSHVKTYRYVIDEHMKKHIYSYFKVAIDRWGYTV
jgi:hypothetical protein